MLSSLKKKANNIQEHIQNRCRKTEALGKNQKIAKNQRHCT